jgi:hypothetical protein
MVRFIRNGWYFDSYRHSLAARGILTSRRLSLKDKNVNFATKDFIPIIDPEAERGDDGEDITGMEQEDSEGKKTSIRHQL